MANSLCSTPICSFDTSNRPGIISTNSVGRKAFQMNEVCPKARNFQSLEVKTSSHKWKKGTGPRIDSALAGLSESRSHLETLSDLALLQATDNDQSTKPKSIVCPQCDANGAILCTQCKGTGVNSVDHFNGQFKAGGLCWLCRGKKEILCGNCNGAGFLGGFMSSFDD